MSEALNSNSEFNLDDTDALVERLGETATFQVSFTREVEQHPIADKQTSYMEDVNDDVVVNEAL